MAEFYEPSLLLRQNAIRRSPNSSMESLTPTTNTRVSWENNFQDCDVLNKSCSMNRLNIKSNYWKIPDTNMNLTAMSIVGGVDDNATIAIASGNKESNLFIYDLDVEDKFLSHQSTITLPNIHGLEWVPKNSGYLVTGNNKGYAHLISIPKPGELNEDGEEVSAEICKRFNHRKHVKNETTTTLRNSNISKLKFMDKLDNLLSIYNNNLFHWDLNQVQSQLKPSPLSITKVQGIMNFDPLQDSVIGICGRFGVSLFDLRNPKFQVPSSQKNIKKQSAYLMKWNPQNENVFASCHRDGVVRLWDVRKQESFANLYGHQDRLVSLEWNKGDLFTGGRDGNIIHWDLTNDVTDLTTCTLKEGLSSVNFDSKSNQLKPISLQRQCGTILPASNTNIISMGSINDGQDTKVLSIDGSSYFGVHNKIYDAINLEGKEYYSEADIQLLVGQESRDTLVEEITEPLIIVKDGPYQGLVEFNYSEDTLNEAEEVEEEKPNRALSRSPTFMVPPRPVTPFDFHSTAPFERILHEIEEESETASIASESSSIYLDLSEYKIELPQFDQFDEFDFTENYSESLISITSADPPTSNKSSNIFNDSLVSLSTNPTIEEEIHQESKANPSDNADEIVFRLKDLMT